MRISYSAGQNPLASQSIDIQFKKCNGLSLPLKTIQTGIGGVLFECIRINEITSNNSGFDFSQINVDSVENAIITNQGIVAIYDSLYDSEILATFENCEEVKDPEYNIVTTNKYTPLYDQEITYPIGTYHAISLLVVSGSVLYDETMFYIGDNIDIEVTAKNETPFVFKVFAGSEVLVETVTDEI